MMSFISVKIASRNLLKNYRRTLATLVAVLFGFVAICMLVGYILRTEKALRAQVVYINMNGHLSILAKGAIQFFSINPEKYLISKELQKKVSSLLEAQKEIEYFGFGLSGPGLLSGGKKSFGVYFKGIDPEVFQKSAAHPFVEKWMSALQKADEKNDFYQLYRQVPHSVSITAKMGELLGVRPPFFELSEEARDVTVAGKSFDGHFNAVSASLGAQHTTGFPFQEDTHMFGPLALVQDLFQTEGVTTINIFLKDQGLTQGFRKELQKIFQQAGIQELEIFPFNHEGIGLFYVGTISFLMVMAYFFVFLIVGAVVIAIVNSLTMGILERTKEVGMLRSLGYLPEKVAKMFVLEGFITTLLACVVGIVLSEILAVIINNSSIYFTPVGVTGKYQFQVDPEWWIYPAIAFFLLSVTTFSSYWVAKRKCKKKIVQLLIETGAS